ncbi:MAG: Flp family type IVb pilin [Pirellulaceae bacterium]|nr:Flp family type IVb pilin [Pirellulaceae bacterium]
MKRIFKFLNRFLGGEDGPTAVEYAVMLALIVGAAMVGITSLGNATVASFTDSSTRIDAAVTGS